MQRLPLHAQKREMLGKKVKRLRKEGFLPGHVFGHKIATSHVSVKKSDFLKVYDQAGETGLIDLTVGDDQIRPVLVRAVQTDPVFDSPLHIDFYQVNLEEKVNVVVPIVIVGEDCELIHAGEAVIIQPMNEVEVEALPTNLPENIEVDKTSLKEIGDSVTVADLKTPQGVTILADPQSIVIKLDTAVSAETQALLEEQAAAEAAAVAAAEVTAEGEEAVSEVAAGEEVKEDEEVGKEAPKTPESEKEEKVQQ